MCTCICQPRSVSALQITSPMLAMSTMADDVEATLAEVRNVSRLLGTEGFRGAADALLRSLCTRIAATPLDVSSASIFADVVGECRFTPQQKNTILAAASTRVSTSVALRRAPSSLGQRPTPQRLHHPENYLLPSDWAAMEDKTFTRRYHLQVLCDRLSLVGLRNPSESTFAAMAGLMQTVLGVVGDATSAYDLLQQLKQTWRA